jgi:oxygen-dependent protoporphyrinogen oxidase
LAEAVRTKRSLLLGLRGVRSSVPADAGSEPVFFSLRGGLSTLVDALAAALDQHGVKVCLGTPVDEVPDADVVVLTTPAAASARLLEGVSPEAAAELRGIEHASVVLATLAYPALPLKGSGFLVPRVDGRLMTACSFGSNKWPHWSRPGQVVLRVSAGRAGDNRAIEMGDEEVVDALDAELRQAIGVVGPPLAPRITRWVDGFPQYAPGHRARVHRIESALRRDAPTIRVAGAALHGVGIPACIASGRAAVPGGGPPR